MIKNEMRISSVNKARRNEHSHTLLAGINVNLNNLSRKYKYITEVSKLFILYDPVTVFLEVLINSPNAVKYLCPMMFTAMQFIIAKKKLE